MMRLLLSTSQVMVLRRLGRLRSGDVGRWWWRWNCHHVFCSTRCHRRRRSHRLATATISRRRRQRIIHRRTDATTVVLGPIAPAVTGRAIARRGRGRRQRTADWQRLTSVRTKRVMLLILRLTAIKHCKLLQHFNTEL